MFFFFFFFYYYLEDRSSAVTLCLKWRSLAYDNRRAWRWRDGVHVQVLVDGDENEQTLIQTTGECETMEFLSWLSKGPSSSLLEGRECQPSSSSTLVSRISRSGKEVEWTRYHPPLPLPHNYRNSLIKKNH